MCDIGRVEYKEIALETRLGSARIRSASNGGASWAPATLDAALDAVHERLQQAGAASAFVASPQATNEDLYAFRLLADKVGGMLDFRVGNPAGPHAGARGQRAPARGPQPEHHRRCLDLGLGRDGIDAILAACRSGKVKALVLQGPELLRFAGAADALAAVPFIAVMASHDGPGLERAHVVLPAAVWAEVDGTFTNYQRRVQRIRRAVAAPGDATAALGAGGARCCGGSAPRWPRPRPASCSRRSRGPCPPTPASTSARWAADGPRDPAGRPGARRRPGPDGRHARRHRRPQPKAGVGPILLGMAITFSNMVKTLFGRQVSTIQFPEQKRNTSGRYRGIHVLTQRMDGTPKCVACYMCATVCPAECIYIEAGERPEQDIEKYPTRFEIDLLRCVYCGFCVDACPEEAIIMSRENDLVGTTRAELIIDRDRLMDRGKLMEYGAGYRPDEHDVRRPVRIAALERLKREHGIVPAMPRRSE